MTPIQPLAERLPACLAGAHRRAAERRDGEVALHVFDLGAGG